MRRTPLIAIFSLLLLAFGLATEIDARGPKKWQPLGSRVVADRIDRDTIVVADKGGTFTALRLAVKRRGVQFRSMKVHFANGDVQDVELRSVIPAGGASRVIDLPGNRRAIKKVTFVYDAQALGGRTATVRLFGRR